MAEVFRVERKGPKGPDTEAHTFCVVAVANREAVRLNYSGVTAAINGASGHKAREGCKRFCAALNALFDDYMNGKFHEDNPNPPDMTIEEYMQS